MAAFCILIGVVAVIIVLAVAFHNKGTGSYRGNSGYQTQMNPMMYTNMNDMNFNGVPDSMEPLHKDSDHDGIPDYMDNQPYNPDNVINADNVNSYNDNSISNGVDQGSTNSYFGGESFDSGSQDTGNFDSGSQDIGTFDSGSQDTGNFDVGNFDSGSFDSSGFDSGNNF